jgi:hypothetical protein
VKYHLPSILIMMFFLLHVILRHKSQKHSKEITNTIILHTDEISKSIGGGNGKHFQRVFKEKSVK